MKQFGNKITSSKFKCVASGQKWSLFAAKHNSRRNNSIVTGERLLQMVADFGSGYLKKQQRWSMKEPKIV
jgi:hypothetical protein